MGLIFGKDYDGLADLARLIDSNEDAHEIRTTEYWPATICHDQILSPNVFGFPNLVRDRFTLGKLLGEGAGGVVWEAMDHRYGDRVVALKASHSRAGCSRVEREARSLMKLDHHAIAKLYETIDLPNGTMLIVAEFVEGRSLDRISKPGHVQSAMIAIQVADALEHAHSRGFVHRDVKPGNIMMRPNGTVVLIDFGLVSASPGDAKISREGVILGTPAYMPPEQARGEPVDRRADVYSLGATLYNLVTGIHPFRGGLYQVLSDIAAEKQLIRPRRIDRSISPSLQSIILKAMNPKSDQRYETAGAMAADLRQWLLDRSLQKPAEKILTSVIWGLVAKLSLLFE